MPNRLTKTEKWGDPWFRRLKPTQKCFWQYLCDNCDIAGVIDLDKPIAEAMIGGRVSMDDFEGRVVSLGDTRYWIVGFIEYQQHVKMEELNPANKAHLAILRIIEKYNLLQVRAQLQTSPIEGASKGLPSPTGIGIGIGIGKGTAEKPKFEPPTLAQVEEYMTSQMPAVAKRCPGIATLVFPKQEAPLFVGHYVQHEWKIKSKPMLDWKKSAYNWLIKAYQFKQERVNR